MSPQGKMPDPSGGLACSLKLSPVGDRLPRCVSFPQATRP